MSRPIKFRAWDGEKMLFGPDFVENLMIHTTGRNSFSFSYHRDDAVTFMQYTGLKDKNGVEIYEGDIVRVNDDWDEPTTHEVKWGGDYPAFEIYPCFDLESNNLMSALEGEGGMTVEVIGNIYETPELLEAKS